MLIGRGGPALPQTTQDEPAVPPRVEISVDVTPASRELADRQLKQQEHQRVLGVFPNFRVSYEPNAAPLDPRQKFHLTWKTIADPVSFAGTGVIAGIQHARNDFSGFGDGADGYAKRFAALYATRVTSTMISNVALPALFRQDPRVLLQRHGERTFARRLRDFARRRYARATTDDGSRTIHVSSAISPRARYRTCHYPPEDRRGIGLTLTNTAIGLGGAAIGNLMQEFVLARFTTHARRTRDSHDQPLP